MLVSLRATKKRDGAKSDGEKFGLRKMNFHEIEFENARENKIEATNAKTSIFAVSTSIPQSACCHHL